jgi:hypothetical protein
MGLAFRYIADNALAQSNLGSCQHCERTEFSSYDYCGEIINPRLAANVELATTDNKIFAACAACIHGGNIRKTDFELGRVQPIIDSFALDKVSAARNYHLIPHIPLMMQDQDWPMCCGDWCEYVGNPKDDEESVRVPSQFQFWDHRPSNETVDDELRPESLREVCLFRCLSCARLLHLAADVDRMASRCNRPLSKFRTTSNHETLRCSPLVVSSPRRSSPRPSRAA